MKTTTTFIAIIFITITGYTQQHWGLPDSGSVYTYVTSQWGSENSPLHHTWGEEVEMENELWREYTVTYSAGSGESTYLLREDEGIWFLKNTDWDDIELEEFPLYHWTAEVGDTILSASREELSFQSVFSLKVDSIHQQEFLDGSERKVFFLTNIDFNMNQAIVWIEGIGMINDITTNAVGTSIVDGGSELICAHLGDTWVYESESAQYLTDYENCSWSPIGVNEISKSGIEIFPNPADDVMRIEFSSSKELLAKNGLLEIFDSKGRIIKQVQLTSIRVLEISLDDIPSGIYLLQLKGEGISHSQRLVIQH